MKTSMEQIQCALVTPTTRMGLVALLGASLMAGQRE